MNPKITVNHVKEHNVIADLHIYCGRGDAPPNMVNGKVGNPFPMGSDESKRDEVCAAYNKWLHGPQAGGHLRVLERMVQRVNEGKSLALYCWCSPKRCHCDTIREYVLTNVNFG